MWQPLDTPSPGSVAGSWSSDTRKGTLRAAYPEVQRSQKPSTNAHFRFATPCSNVMATKLISDGKMLNGKSCWSTFFNEQEAAEDTPSRRDGMPKNMEANLRKNYVMLIQDVCIKFKT
eukprot:scaffold32697_cov33-Prasinocladus_malaysianus.AAC.1